MLLPGCQSTALLQSSHPSTAIRSTTRRRRNGVNQVLHRYHEGVPSESWTLSSSTTRPGGPSNQVSTTSLGSTPRRALKAVVAVGPSSGDRLFLSSTAGPAKGLPAPS